MESIIHQNITKIGYTLYPIAYKFCKDSQIAEDIVQDTLLKALMNAHRYQEGTNLKGWLYTIMRNIFINEYRRKKRFFYMENANEFDIHSEERHFSYNNALSFLGCQEIQSHVETVENKHATPFLMYFNGYKYEEIAQQLQLPLGTVKNRIHIARKELQQKIENTEKACQAAYLSLTSS